MIYRDYEDFLTEEEWSFFQLDELYEASGGRNGLQLSGEWKLTILEAASKRREEHERTKTKSKSPSKA
jgi:hypothetical protein